MRSIQFLPYLEAHGFEITVAPFADDAYLEALFGGRGWSRSRIVPAYARRMRLLRTARNFDVLWIEKECLPWVPSFIERGLMPAGVPYLVDYDDAVFHRYDHHRLRFVRSVLGGKIDEVIAGASVVTVGNRYLAHRAHLAGVERVEVLPTVVDTARYEPRKGGAEGVFTVGWIGTPVTTTYVQDVLEPVRALCRQVDARLVLVGAGALASKGVKIRVLPWAVGTEARDIATFDVGIMPLRDGPFERGKCGYKLIQYMASGLPVVASPVGVNTEIVEPGVNGFLAGTSSEWTEALLNLARDPERAAAMGEAGLQKARGEYDISVTAPRLASLLQEAAAGGRPSRSQL